LVFYPQRLFTKIHSLNQAILFELTEMLISQLLAAAGHTLLPLPRYSPDLNPIEQAFAILKRQRQFSGREVGDLISSHY
jgi:transposase